jgi:hypothetical protein
MSQPNVEKEAGPPAHSDTSIEEKPATEKKVREYKEFGHDEAKPTRTFLSLGLRVNFSGLTSILQMPMSTCQGYDSFPFFPKA